MAIVATSFHAVDPTVDPNHDADMRIGSEAPKQRVPNLDYGMKAIGVGEQPRYLGSPLASPKLEFMLSPPLNAFFACYLCR